MLFRSTACSTDAQCPSTRGHCSNGGCVACQVNSDCTGNPHGTVCLNGACVECIVSTECPTGQTCDAASKKCVSGCGSAGECPTGFVCDTATLTCIQCTSNDQCSGSTPVCDATSHACVQCNADSDCQPGFSCNTHKHQCATKECLELDVGGDGIAAALLKQAGGTRCLTRLSGNSCPPDATSKGAHSTATCLQWLTCNSGNKNQWWVRETYGTSHVWSTTSEDLTAALDAQFATSSLQGSDGAGDYAYVTPGVPTAGSTKWTTGMSNSPQGFSITSATDGDTLVLGHDASHFATWGATGDTLVAQFVNPSFTACKTWADP